MATANSEGSGPKPWEKGGPSPNPSGRKPVPEWLRADACSDALLRFQYDAVLTGRMPLAPPGDDDEPDVTDDGEVIPPSKTQVVPPKVRAALADALLNRIHGKPPIVVDAPPPDPKGSALARLYAAAEKLEELDRVAATTKPDG